MIFHYFIVVALISAAIAIERNFTAIVKTKSGPIRGEILNTVRKSFKYAAFKGIPYGEPPVGLQRFKPPTPKKKWTDVLDATTEGSACVQYDLYNLTVIGSEDCLYLNVYTPHVIIIIMQYEKSYWYDLRVLQRLLTLKFTKFNSKSLKAVMVFIHGGGFQSGYSNSHFYGPDFLIENDVILVAFNYRLNVFGFLNLNHENATGNAGLKDQHLALDWVNNNIILFGGNPKKITLFGQSAGAVSVELHMFSNMSRGLFSRSISMSGSSLSFYWPVETSIEAEYHAFLLGARLGITTANKEVLLQKFYSIPAYSLVRHTFNPSVFSFRPTIERVKPADGKKRFIKQCFLNTYLSGKFYKVPHILGFTTLEAVLYPEFIVSFSLKTILERNFNTTITNISMDNPIFRFIYYLTRRNFALWPRILFKELMELLSDIMVRIGTDSSQRLLAKHNKFPTYYYVFSGNSSFNQIVQEAFNIEGIGHTEDLPFIFYVPQGKLSLTDNNTSLMIDTFTRLWTNFAKYGNPTPPEAKTDLYWPPSGKRGIHYEIKLQPRVGPRPLRSRARAIQKLGIEQLPILNDCNRFDKP